MFYGKILSSVLATGALAACPGDTPTSPTTDSGLPDPATEGMATIAVPTDITFAERGSANGRCPQIEGYSVGLLFDVDPTECLDGCLEERPDAPPRSVGDSITADLWPGMPDRLARYCSYLPDPDHSPPPEEIDIENVGLAGAQRARMVVAPSAAGLEAQLTARYQAKAQQQIGLCNTQHDQPVRLTLLDTSATCPPGGGCLDDGTHGEPLASILGDTLCGGSPGCPIEVRQRVAMPLRSGPSWQINDGGHFGSLDWLAQAIVREVRAWQTESAGTPLILNLSLAWHPDYGGSNADRVFIDRDDLTVDRADVLAVYDALRYARCSGALVIAAVGNRSGVDDRGAMYPARWATHIISETECGEDFDIAPSFVPFGPETPLLYAASGIDAEGGSLGIARLESTPNLVAYGQHVPGFSSKDATHLPLTGSSVGTVLVSAVAAQTWSLHPTETADQIMQRVWSGGDPLDPVGMEADLHLSAFDDAHPRRVAQCGDPNVVLPPISWAKPSSSDLPVRVVADPFDGIYTSYLPFAFPTPETQECPVCGLDIDLFDGPVGQLYLALEPGITDPTWLAIQDGSGSWSRVELGLVESPTQRTVPLPPDPRRAVVLFQAPGDEAQYRSEVHLIGSSTP